METSSGVTAVLVFFGAILMLIALSQIGKLISSIAGNVFIRNWKQIMYLAGIFFFGYIGVLILLYLDETHFLILITGGIFFLGALFVLLVVYNGKITIQELIRTSVSKSYLSNIIESMTDSLIVVNTNHESTVRTVNRAAQRLLKYEKNELVGAPVTSIFGIELTENIDLSDLKAGRFISECEGEYVTKDGNKIPILFSAAPMLSRKNDVEGIIFVAQDITERKENEKKIQEFISKLTESEKSLQELNANKDRFFSIIAHDLRSPFSALLGYSEIIATEYKDLTPEELKEFATNLHDQAKSVFELLENLLTWSRIQTGRIVYEPEFFPVSKIMKDIGKLYEENAKQKGISVICACDTNVMAYADSNMISTVLRNLVSNALKFTPTGGEIRIAAEKVEKQCKIMVSDTGKGIPEETRKRLFKIDQNVTTLGTNAEKGTGLGLILCKELLDKNNGTIELTSAVDGGTTFTISLPC
ncbi:MAG: PAS domain S-box protein [Ignavibacteriales bacterium]|nr:PAS domain S-box protein [Ignavibacteriales bacterium]MCF8316817.1 PAS domain S-box protein [Ignavibacteriales bacterium]MCF8438393.1 PAS domain S-box protein [Ignavibacteriales bacterium]